MNNLQEVVRYVRSALDHKCVFVHMTAPQLESLLAGLEEQKREIDRLEKRLGASVKIGNANFALAEKLLTEHTAMKKALEWYGDEENYKRTEEDYQSGYPREIMWDKGIKARNILAALTKEESA